MFLEQRRQIKLLLLGVDLIAFILSLIVSLNILEHIIFPAFPGRSFQINDITLSTLFPVLVFIWIFMNWREGLYVCIYRRKSLFLGLLKAGLTSFLLFLFLAFFFKQIPHLGPRVFWAVFFVTCITILFISKKVALFLLDRFLKARQIIKSVAIYGHGVNGKKIASALHKIRTYYNFVGYFDDFVKNKHQYLGTFNDIENVVKEKSIDEIIIALPHKYRNRLKEIIEECLKLHIDWKIVPDALGIPLEETYLTSLQDIPLLAKKESHLEGVNLFLKIVLDKILACFFLLILSPLIIVVSILIKISSPGPVFFKQKRVGKKGKLFDVYKFRSMKVGTSSKEHEKFVEKVIEGKVGKKDKKEGIFKLKADVRITPVGRFIRALSIDEIPQFINVLKGDMSIVGPRPAIPYELKWYKEWQKERLKVAPGITGLWQISGRNRLKFDQGVKLDLKYIHDWSFSLDFDIMIRTVWVVLFARER